MTAPAIFRRYTHTPLGIRISLDGSEPVNQNKWHSHEIQGTNTTKMPTLSASLARGFLRVRDGSDSTMPVHGLRITSAATRKPEAIPTEIS
mmetsp:Transcript_64569/g.131359  ORF Transcript_64569/g.131359 Transcript_64569/m.131359 type:complete len:91 (+) Transcript_64569:576-848(+)